GSGVARADVRGEFFDRLGGDARIAVETRTLRGAATVLAVAGRATGREGLLLSGKGNRQEQTEEAHGATIPRCRIPRTCYTYSFETSEEFSVLWLKFVKFAGAVRNSATASATPTM